MRKNYFQDVKIADKLKMIMKAIFAILLVNNISVCNFNACIWTSGMDYHSCHCSSWYAIAFQKDHSGTDTKYS